MLHKQIIHTNSPVPGRNGQSACAGHRDVPECSGGAQRSWWVRVSAWTSLSSEKSSTSCLWHSDGHTERATMEIVSQFEHVGRIMVTRHKPKDSLERGSHKFFVEFKHLKALNHRELQILLSPCRTCLCIKAFKMLHSNTAQVILLALWPRVWVCEVCVNEMLENYHQHYYLWPSTPEIHTVSFLWLFLKPGVWV